MHLVFDIRTAYESGFKDHPEKVMRQIGVDYTHSTPQTAHDKWIFWNCRVLPRILHEPLPRFLTRLTNQDPFYWVGLGISREDAEDISRYDIAK